MKPKVHRARRAVVVGTDRQRNISVKDSRGAVTVFICGSIHYPGPLEAGTRGLIRYIPSSSMSLDWFTPYKNQSGRKP